MGATPLSTLPIVENLEDDPGLPKPTSSLPASVQFPQQQPLPPSPASSPAPSPTLTPVRAPSPRASGSGWHPARPPSLDLFGCARGRTRSVRDQLSFRAGAALSVVQDTYGDARDARARDAGSGSGGDGSSPSPRRASPSVNAASAPTTLSRFEPPRVTQAVRESTFSCVSTGTAVNPCATTRTTSTSVEHVAYASTPRCTTCTTTVYKPKQAINSLGLGTPHRPKKRQRRTRGHHHLRPSFTSTLQNASKCWWGLHKYRPPPDPYL